MVLTNQKTNDKLSQDSVKKLYKSKFISFVKWVVEPFFGREEGVNNNKVVRKQGLIVTWTLQ